MDQLLRDLDRASRSDLDTDLRRAMRDLAVKYLHRARATASPAATVIPTMASTAVRADELLEPAPALAALRSERSHSATAGLRAALTPAPGRAAAADDEAASAELAELLRQRASVERTAATVRRHALQSVQVAERKASRAVAENEALMEEANLLRREVVQQRDSLHTAAAVVRVYEQRAERAARSPSAVVGAAALSGSRSVATLANAVQLGAPGTTPTPTRHAAGTRLATSVSTAALPRMAPSRSAAALMTAANDAAVLAALPRSTLPGSRVGSA